MSDEKRGSYNSKNNITQQLHFLNEFVTYYSLKNLSDMNTEISCNSNINYEKINELLPELKKYFKVSGLNLCKIGNKVATGRQALGILRKLCSQARIPYEFDKTENGYTFSLTPLNEEWINFLKLQEKNKTYVETTQNSKIAYPISDKIIEHKTPLLYRHHLTDTEWDRLNPDIKYTTKPEENSPFYARAVASRETLQEFDLRYTAIECICINPENNNNSFYRIESEGESTEPRMYFLFSRFHDYIEKIESIEVYDESMNPLEILNSDVVLSNDTGYSGIEYTINNVNIPIVQYRFLGLYLRVNMRNKNLEAYKGKIYLKFIYTCLQYSSTKVRKLERKTLEIPRSNYFSQKRDITCYSSKTWNLCNREGKYRITCEKSIKVYRNGELHAEGNVILIDFDELHPELKDYIYFEIEHNNNTFSVQRED